MTSSKTSLPMSSRFRDKLKQIRDASQKRIETSHRIRTEADIQRSQLTVAAFEYREALEAVIDDFVENFLTEAPGFALTRGFFEGKYMLALRCDEQLLDGDGRPGTYFSRLMFLLDPHSTDGTFAIQCRKTIRDKDRETTHHATTMDETGRLELEAFIETAFLDFAEHYFGETNLTRPSTGVPG